MRREDEFDPGSRPERESPHPGPETVPRSGIRPRWIVAGVAAVLLLIFAIQNSERVDVDFLVFDAQVRVVAVIVVSAALGFVVGWLLGRPSRAQRKAMERGLKD
jgi:uncharacterized integral membrane protein